MTFDPAATLAELLTHARQSGCPCPVCTELRSLWTRLDVDQAVTDARGEVPRPGTVCAGCWTSPALAYVRTGGAALATLTTTAGRCSMCGMPA